MWGGKGEKGGETCRKATQNVERIRIPPGIVGFQCGEKLGYLS